MIGAGGGEATRLVKDDAEEFRWMAWMNGSNDGDVGVVFDIGLSSLDLQVS